MVTQNKIFFLILRRVYCAEGGAEGDDNEEAAHLRPGGDHLRQKLLTGRSPWPSLVLSLEEEARGPGGEAGVQGYRQDDRSTRTERGSSLLDLLNFPLMCDTFWGFLVTHHVSKYLGCY